MALWFPDSNGYAASRIYTNSMQFGDIAHMHTDNHKPGSVTALVYPNEHWDLTYAGETM